MVSTVQEEGAFTAHIRGADTVQIEGADILHGGCLHYKLAAASTVHSTGRLYSVQIGETLIVQYGGLLQGADSYSNGLVSQFVYNIEEAASRQRVFFYQVTTGGGFSPATKAAGNGSFSTVYSANRGVLLRGNQQAVGSSCTIYLAENRSSFTRQPAGNGLLLPGIKQKEDQ